MEKGKRVTDDDSTGGSTGRKTSTLLQVEIKMTCRTNLYTSCTTKGSKGNCLLYTKTASAPRRPPAARLASRFGASCLTGLWWWTPICSLLPHLGDGKGSQSNTAQFSSVHVLQLHGTLHKKKKKKLKMNVGIPQPVQILDWQSVTSCLYRF